MKSSISINTFEQGMVSDELGGRYDIDIYKNSLIDATNVLPMSLGGMTKRPGSTYIEDSNAYDAETYEAIRLVPFKVNSLVNYVLEFTHGKMRVLINGALVESEPGVPYELSTGIHGAIVQWMTVAQVNDKLYIANSWMPPKVLTRIDHDNWKIANVDFYWGPFQDENTLVGYTMAASATTGDITITSNISTFSTLSVGQKMKFRAPSSTSEDLKLDPPVKDVNSDTMVNYGYANKNELTQISVTGEWTGNIRLQKTVANVWIDVTVFDYNAAFPDTATEDNTQYRCIFEFDNTIEDGMSEEEKTAIADAIGTATITITNLSSFGVAEITGYVSDTVVNATVEKRLPTTDAIYTWSHGSWGPFDFSTGEGFGYPLAVTFHNQRLILAGSAIQPQTFWGSVIDDYTNFDEGVNADDAFEFTIDSTEKNDIHWLYSGQVLFCGTDKGEYQLSHPSVALTPTSPYVVSHTNIGSNWWTGALNLGDSILFCQYGTPSAHILIYDYKTEKFTSHNISEQMKEVFQEGENIKYMSYSKKPLNIVYFVTDNGFIIAMRYDRKSGNVAFTRIETDGDYKAIATIPSLYGDVTYTVVDRGGSFFTIEYFATSLWSDHTEDSLYMDSSLQYVGTAKSTFSNLDHLEGKDVVATVNGTYVGTYTVSSGSITLGAGREGSGTVIVNIGLPYESRLKTQRLMPPGPYGASIGERISISNLKLNLYKTIGLKAGCSDDNVSEVKIDTNNLSATYEPFSGIIDFYPGQGGHFDNEQFIILEHDKPYPMSILSVAYTATVNSK